MLNRYLLLIISGLIFVYGTYCLVLLNIYIQSDSLYSLKEFLILLKDNKLYSILFVIAILINYKDLEIRLKKRK